MLCFLAGRERSPRALRLCGRTGGMEPDSHTKDPPQEGHRRRRRSVVACPVCSGHAKHTPYGHGVPEMYLQRGCEIPARCPGSWGWDVAGIGAPRDVPRDHEDLITGIMLPVRGLFVLLLYPAWHTPGC